MVQQRNILILLSETGGGHVSLAEALRERPQPGYTIRIEDLLPGIISDMYRSIAQKAPWLWSYAFHLSDSPTLARLEHRLALPFITPRLLALLESFQPDLILSVHPLLTYNVKQALDRYAPHIPFAMLLCDPASTHATWYTERDAKVGATSGVIVAERPTWVVSTLKQIANRAGETVFRVLVVIRLPIL